MLLSLLSLWITTKQSPTCARGNEKTLGGYTQGGMIEWSQKSRPKNIPRASSKTPKKN